METKITYDDVIAATEAVVTAINFGSKADVKAARAERDKVEAAYLAGVQGGESPFEPEADDESPRAEFIRRAADEEKAIAEAEYEAEDCDCATCRAAYHENWEDEFSRKLYNDGAKPRGDEVNEDMARLARDVELRWLVGKWGMTEGEVLSEQKDFEERAIQIVRLARAGFNEEAEYEKMLDYKAWLRDGEDYYR